MKKIYTIILLAFWVLSANAQWTQITGTNISGTAEYKGLVYTGTSVLMATEGGIYRSTDNGVSWNLSVTGLDSTNLSVNDIAYISSRNEVWIASNGGIFKSTNDGVLWNKITPAGLSGSGWTQRLGRIGNRLVIAYSEYDNILHNNVTKLCYSDNGTNWTYGSQIATGNNIWIDFVEDFNNKGLWYIINLNDGSGSKLWYTETGTTVGLFPMTGVNPDAEIESNYFSVDPSGNNVFLIDREAKKILRFNSGSQSWEEKMTGIGGSGLTLTELFGIHSLGAHVFASAMFTDISSTLFLKLYYSSDNGETWTEITNPGVDFPVFEDQMIIAGSGRLIGSYFNSLMAYSDNIGQTWTKITNINSGSFDYLVGLSDGTVFATTSDELTGVVKSTDNGATWTIQNGDLPTFLGLHFIDAVLPGGPTTMYLTAAENPFDEKYYLYKSTDAGQHWEKITTAPDSSVKQFVGRHGGTSLIMYFGNKNGTGTYQYTVNEGSTWTNLSPAISALSVDRVMGIKGNGTLMILFAEKAGKVRVYKSTDQGISFTDITSNLDVSYIEIMVADRWTWDRQPSAIASFSSDGTSFVLAAYKYDIYPNEVCFYALNETLDGWSKIGSQGIKVQYNFECYGLRHNQGVWYFITPVGVYASADNCNTWLRVWNNEGFVKGLRPKAFVANNYGLFLGTDNGGLWKTALTAPSISTLTATEITDISAKSGGTVISTGGLPFSNKGLCWATHTTPVITDNNQSAGNSWDSFTLTISSLAPNTTYYVRAFIQNPKGLVYGDEISLKTENASGITAEKTGEVKLYPNPSEGIFNIVSDADMTLTVMNVIGKVVLTAPVYTGLNTYELKNQPAGIYFVRVTEGNRAAQTIRLVIK